MIAVRGRKPSAPPTVALLGNSTVRLLPTQGARLLFSRAQEYPTARFCAGPLIALPASLRALLTGPLVVCSVHTEARQRLRAFAAAQGLPWQEYAADFGPGLPVRLPAAARKTVGRDRLAAAKAALDEFPGGALVCDVGTALTVNRVTPRGFEGGLIAPGLQMALDAMHKGTSQLPRVSAATARFPARNTAAALHLGALSAVAGTIEKIYRAEAAGRPGLPLILTGGGGIIIRRILTPRGVWRPHLVATGVWSAFRESCAGALPSARRPTGVRG